MHAVFADNTVDLAYLDVMLVLLAFGWYSSGIINPQGSKGGRLDGLALLGSAILALVASRCWFAFENCRTLILTLPIFTLGLAIVRRRFAHPRFSFISSLLAGVVTLKYGSGMIAMKVFEPGPEFEDSLTQSAAEAPKAETHAEQPAAHGRKLEPYAAPGALPELSPKFKPPQPVPRGH